MEQATLLHIDQELESHEVSALCFLSRDVVNKKDLEKVQDAKELFNKLSQKGLLENHVFLCELLETINRRDLLDYLRTNNGPSCDTDAIPILSNYRKMLYQIYDECTQENFEKITFLLMKKLGRRAIEKCNTTLDLFVEMERVSLLSSTNLNQLIEVLPSVAHNLAVTVHHYIQHIPQQTLTTSRESVVNTTRPTPDDPVPVHAVPTKSSLSLENDDYYPLNHMPRGPCVIINNENFSGYLPKRRGTDKDEIVLRQLFTELGFTVSVHNDLSGREIRQVLNELSATDFREADALVVLVLSHGENNVVFGVDQDQVLLSELTHPFTSNRVPTLAGKPKVFFIQACQGNDYQTGAILLREEPSAGVIEDDAGPVSVETVPVHADFLLGMATIPKHRSYRHVLSGSIYIQELCRQLKFSAESSGNDDILTVLTRVNREISKQDFMKHKQMPEPKYTLTRKLVLKYVQSH